MTRAEGGATPPPRRARCWALRLAAVHRRWPLLALALVAFAYATDLLEPIELRLMDLRFELLHRDADERIAVVGIDARSLQELDTWPWPRRYHAEVIEHLIESGARRIVLDIDFSSRSTPEEDAILAATLARHPGKVVLPVFKSPLGLAADGSRLKDAQPIASLRPYVDLASVVVRQEEDGLVRRLSTREDVGGTGVPGIPTLLSGIRGAFDGFYIDYAIQPKSVAVLPYVDVLSGRFDPASVRGRDVIVGSTAVELGDTLPVPVYRNLPGPVVLALGHQSLVQGRALQRTGALPSLAVAALLAMVLRGRFRSWTWRAGLIVAGAGIAGGFGGSVAVQAVWPVSVDTVPWHLTLILLFGEGMARRVEHQALRIFQQSMAVMHRTAVMRSVAESSSDAILVLDHTGRIEFYNEAARRLFGCSAVDLQGMTVDGLLEYPTESLGEPVEGRARCEGGAMVPVEILVQKSVLRTGRSRFERRHDAREVLSFSVRDISERKRVEEARQQAMNEALSASRAKTEFLAAMSHELRTPLNAIIGFSEMMEAEIYGPLGSERYRSYAQDIHGSGQHLLDVVNDILDVARVEAGKTSLNEELVDVAACAASALRILAARAQVGGLKMCRRFAPDLPRLLGDERVIKQILVNLLSNAVKFTPTGGEITVEIEEIADGRIRIAVIDTGIGIAADEIPKVLQPFYQVDRALARKFEGTGLGLSLVKSFVEAHGGAFELASELGRGTAATCLFPATRVRRLCDTARQFDRATAV